MTQVRYDRVGNSFLLACQGHAGYAEKGKDIVCAGISALCGALEIALDNLQDKGLVQTHFCAWSDAYFIAEATATDENNGVRTAFEVIYDGFCRMEEEYAAFMECRKSNAEEVRI